MPLRRLALQLDALKEVGCEISIFEQDVSTSADRLIEQADRIHASFLGARAKVDAVSHRLKEIEREV